MLVRDEIECEPRGALQVKGFHAPVEAYEVTESALREAAVDPPAEPATAGG